VSTLQIVVLAVVQGITEFLPISSSAHLILTPHLFGWPDQGLLVDLAVHIGSLVAVLVYFWRDILMMLYGLPRLFTDPRDPGARLIVLILVATIPAVVIGVFAKHTVETEFRSIALIGWTTVIWGIVLYIGDRWGATVRRIEHLTVGTALVIGIAQAIAMVPGTSRSGITMTTARFLGLQRADAARFSFLLSIPTIAGAGILGVKDLMQTGSAELQHDALFAAIIACATAFGAIWFLMNYLKRATFTPFVIYRVLLGLGLLTWVYLL
jgi:undecaprenyl-diphosphatase